jgi:hypothetical protein
LGFVQIDAVFVCEIATSGTNTYDSHPLNAPFRLHVVESVSGTEKSSDTSPRCVP